MNHIWSIISFFLISVQCIWLRAADWRVTPNGSGARTGVDWDNAWANWNGIDTDRVRPGDTIWFAGGTYGPWMFGPNQNWRRALSGAPGQPITLNRAVAFRPECTGSPGWNSSFDSTIFIQNGDGAHPHMIQVDDLTGTYGSYIVIDGMTGHSINGVVVIPYGIQINHNHSQINESPERGAIDFYYGIVTDFTIRHVRVTGVLGVPNSEDHEDIIATIGATQGHVHRGITLSHCRFDYCANVVDCGRNQGLTIEDCYFYDMDHNGHVGIAHSDTMYFHLDGAPTSDIAIRRCTFNHCWNEILYFSADTAGATSQGVRNVSIDGNIFLRNGAEGVKAIDFHNGRIENAQVHNNTFYDCWGILLSSFENHGGFSGGSFRNNLICSINNSLPRIDLSHDGNWYNNSSANGEANGVAGGFGTDPFVNLSQNNLQIKASIGGTFGAREIEDVPPAVATVEPPRNVRIVP